MPLTRPQQRNQYSIFFQLVSLLMSAQAQRAHSGASPAPQRQSALERLRAVHRAEFQPSSSARDNEADDLFVIDDALPDPPVEVEPQVSSTGRPLRSEKARRWPARYGTVTDTLPEIPAVADPSGSLDENEWENELSEETPSRRQFLELPGGHRLRLTGTTRTSPSHFNLARVYLERMADLPGTAASAPELMDVPEPTEVQVFDIQQTSPYWPYENKSSYLLGKHYWNGSLRKSQSDFSSLVDIMKDPEFSLDDIRDTKWHSIDTQLAGGGSDGLGMGWKASDVTIFIPTGVEHIPPASGPSRTRQYNDENPDVEFGVPFTVPGCHHRSLVDLIETTYRTDKNFAHFVHVPYYEYWTPPYPGMPDERIMSELMTSPAMIEEYDKLQASPPEPGCTLPRVIAPLMAASDATHLTQFGDLKLWPVYVMFGNQSKYERAQASSNAMHCVAYMEKVCCETLLCFPR